MFNLFRRKQKQPQPQTQTKPREVFPQQKNLSVYRKRELVRAYAMSLGLCPHCALRKPRTPAGYCSAECSRGAQHRRDYTGEEVRTSFKKSKEDTPLYLLKNEPDHCSRCGIYVGNISHKTCDKCREWNTNYYKEYRKKNKKARKTPKTKTTTEEFATPYEKQKARQMERRRDPNRCNRCGKEKTPNSKYSLCAPCRKSNKEYRRRCINKKKELQKNNTSSSMVRGDTVQSLSLRSRRNQLLAEQRRRKIKN